MKLKILVWMFFLLTPTAQACITLWECEDAGLQTALVELLDRQGLTPQVTKQRLAVAVADITDLERPRVASVNGDQMMYAASLPKIAILLGAFVEMEDGHLAPDEVPRESLHRMIRHSDNRAATRVLRLVGKERLLEILQDERWKLYDPAHGGGLWVGKEYGSQPAYRRDPLHGLSHGATAMQVLRFYYLLESGRLVNPRLTREMKEALVEPAIAHKFVKGLAALPAEARLYRKSGTWRDFHADSVMVEEQGRRYILVALARHPDAGRWFIDLARPLRQLVLGASVSP